MYLHLSISYGFVSSKIYDKRDDFDFDMIPFWMAMFHVVPLIGCIFLNFSPCVSSGFPNGTNGIPISFKVLPMVPLVIPFVPLVPFGTIGTIGKPMVPLATNGTIGKITNGNIWRTPNGAKICLSCRRL